MVNKDSQRDWPFRGRFIPKVPYFGDCGVLKSTFLKRRWWNLARGRPDMGLPFLRLIL